MANRHISSVLLLAAALLAQGASAQTPVRPARFIVPPSSSQNSFLTDVALDGAGNLTSFWWNLGSEVFFRRFSKADAPGPVVRLENPRFDSTGVSMAANQRGDVLMTWSRSPASGPVQHVLRRTSPVLRTLTLPLKGAGDVAVDRNGNFIVVWVAPSPNGFRVFGQRYNANGTPRGPELIAATSTAKANHFFPSVAMNPETGEFVVVWEVRSEDGTGLGVFGQRFGFLTGRQGREFAVFVPGESERPTALQSFAPQVARAALGGFVVIWKKPKPGSFTLDLVGRRYNNAGEAVAFEILIAANEAIPDGRPQISMSPAGDFVVAWDDQGTSPQWFRLYRRNGAPAGPVISQPGMGGAPYYGSGKVSYGWNGTFVYGWTNYNDEGDVGNTISFQRFAASRADEPCLFLNGRFRCDTGRTGGEPETDHVFAIRGGLPVLGDVDGDGREDFCLFRNNRFDCDSGHDNGAAETTILFGQTGDIPLLGNVSGDLRAEACVFRFDRFLCDTDHDGGGAETEIAFGAPGDQPLLGDVDGDGQAEACVYRNRQFLCDTGHNGGAAETTITFGDPGGTPLLGDFDGDGRDDACTFRAGLLRCDTAHNGGTAEATLTLTGPGRPLIGNVDGL
jgi:hypothetical protein